MSELGSIPLWQVLVLVVFIVMAVRLVQASIGKRR
jgi:hypothetical protein